jgi:hypothetical protein
MRAPEKTPQLQPRQHPASDPVIRRLPEFVESDTVLWQSYWWFVPIVLLLTIEWIIRERAGLL